MLLKENLKNWQMSIRNIFFILLSALLLSCSVTPVFVNENETAWDISESIDVPQPVHVSCELRPCDIQQQSIKFQYDIQVIGYRLPELNLNSFCIVSEKGDTIPIQILYSFNKHVKDYNCTTPLLCTGYQGKKGELVVSIVFFLDKPIRPIYVSYDMCVGTRHFTIKSRYKKKVHLDIRGL